MISDIGVASLFLAGTSRSPVSRRASRVALDERSSWWRRRKGTAVETAPPRMFEHADARAHAHVDLTGDESRKRFWQKELRLRRRREADPAVFAVDDESREAADDDWFVSDGPELEAVEATDGGSETELDEMPRRRWFGRKQKGDDVEVDEVVPVEPDENEPVADEKPRRRWFGRKQKQDAVEDVDEFVAVEAEADWVDDADEVFAVEADASELVADERPRRRWFGRKERQDAVEEVEEAFAIEAEADELVADEKPRRRWFAREKNEGSEVEAPELDTNELVADESPRRRWFAREKKNEGSEVEAPELDTDELVAEQKPRRRWFGRKSEDAAVLPVDEAQDEIASVHVEAAAEQDAVEHSRRRWFGRRTGNEEIEVAVDSVVRDSTLEDEQPADEDRSRRRWFGRSKQDEGEHEPEVEAGALAADAIERAPTAEARDSWSAAPTDDELPAAELPVAESLPAPSLESGPEVDSANRQVRELLAWWNEVQAAAGHTEQPSVEDAPPAAPERSHVEEPVSAESVAVEPVAVEPVAVEPVAVEPVSVEPVVETASTSPPVDVPERVEPELSDAARPASDAAETAETVEIAPQPVEPIAVEPVVQFVESEPVADDEPAAPKKRGFGFSLGRDKKAESGDASQPEGTRTAEPKVAKPKRSRGVKKIVGLKIGASQIAAAHVANNGSPELVQLAREPIEGGIVVGGELRDPDALAEALTVFFKKHKLPKKGVRLGIASNRIGVRSFQITGIDDPKQLTNAVRFRAQDALPIPLNEAALDYQVLEESVDETGATVRRVLLVVAYRDLVNRYVDACRKAGIKLIGVDLEAFAVLRALAAPRPAEVAPAGALVVVSVGHDRSTLAVSDGRVCEFTRVLDWGGASLDVALARALDVTPREADPVKRHVSLDGTGPLPHGLTEDQATKARQAMLDQINVFARELVSSLHFYQSQPGSLEIGEIVLTGGGSHLEGLAEHLQQLTGVTVRVGDPLVRMTLKKKAEAPDPVGSLAVAIGLGIED